MFICRQTLPCFLLCWYILNALANSKDISSPTVAIIGCGPSGIAFLHAINLKREKMQEKGDLLGLSKLPTATCFERSSDPGGVWKAQRAHSPSTDDANSTFSGSTNMYEALWTNGPKEMFEFFDYTFHDHFNRSLPPYLPRRLVLDYILNRVQRNEPNFFNNAIFNTEVDFVQFNESLKKFEIMIHHTTWHKKTKLYFDKCIWAAGANGLQYIPQSIETVLDHGNFRGMVMHSSMAGNFLSKVKGKRIVMVGDGFSAEDLTLQALKLGVKDVYILSRSSMGVCTDIASWPGNVHILYDMALTNVTQEGHGMRFSEAVYNAPNGQYDYVANGVITDIEDISAVIYCTGYRMDFSMLDPSLKDVSTGSKSGVRYELKKELQNLASPTNWVMSPNSLTETIGAVELGEWVNSEVAAVYPGLFRGLLISNPNMMFMRDGAGEIPLFDLDIQAWLLIAHIVGDVDTPSAYEMTHLNTQYVAEYMQHPLFRLFMDPNYQMAWKDKVDVEDDVLENLSIDYLRFMLKILARDMQDASYPFSIGTANELNEKGEILLQMFVNSEHARKHINIKERSWRTFRDDNASNYISLHDGNYAIPFDKHWIDIEDTDIGSDTVIPQPRLKSMTIVSY